MQFKKFFAVLPALALSTAMVVAQEPQPTTTQTPQTSVGQPTDTNEPLFKGCLSGTKDNYVLTTSDGKAYRLHSDKDIAEHVGKMVEIRGTVKKEGADRPADAAPASSTSEMDVADVKNIEGTCPTDNSGAAASADMPKAEATTADATTATPATEEQKATVTEPAANAAVSTETPATPDASASPSASANTTTEPSANAAVSTDTTANQTTANQATDTTATAPAATEQNVQSDSAELPQTASPLPLLGLLGFASMGLGLITRRK